MSKNDVFADMDKQRKLRNTKIISNLVFKGKAEIVNVVNSSNKIVHELRLKCR